LTESIGGVSGGEGGNRRDPGAVDLNARRGRTRKTFTIDCGGLKTSLLDRRGTARMGTFRGRIGFIGGKRDFHRSKKR